MPTPPSLFHSGVSMYVNNPPKNSAIKYYNAMLISLLSSVCSCPSHLINTMCTCLYKNNNYYYFYSHRIVMLTTLVKGFPTPLSAAHLYLPLSFPPVMIKGIVTTVLSESLVQVILGFGFPSAEQFKVNSAGAVMVWSLDVVMLLGGAKKSNNGFNAKSLSNETQNRKHMKAVSTSKLCLNIFSEMGEYCLKVLDRLQSWHSSNALAW